MFRPRNLGLAALVLVLPSAATIADAQASPAVGKLPPLVQLTCRGPFLMDVGVSAGFSAKSAAGAAGSHGRNLAAGECALFDRALTATERPIARLDYSTAPMFPNERNLAAVSMLSACALDDNCVVTVLARYGADGIFNADTGRTPTIHKFGRHPNQ